MMNTPVNFILFQAGWFTGVLGAASGTQWLATAGVTGFVVLHLLLTKNRLAELQLILAASTTGFMVDSVLIALGIFSPVNHWAILGPMPAWLLALWALFATTLNHSLRWLARHTVLQASAGLVFAPLAYYAGYKLEALTFTTNEPLYTNFIVIGVCWMIVVPLLYRLAATINRRSQASTDGRSMPY